MCRELALVVLLAACSGHSLPATSNVTTSPPPAADARGVRHWRVYDGDLAILEMSDEPGTLTSTAMPPPGAKPVTHPFLTAAALDAMHEDKLRSLLVASHTMDEFLRALEGAGFRVVAE